MSLSVTFYEVVATLTRWFMLIIIIILTIVILIILTRWFMLATILSHQFFSNDYPNKLVSTLDFFSPDSCISYTCL